MPKKAKKSVKPKTESKAEDEPPAPAPAPLKQPKLSKLRQEPTSEVKPHPCQFYEQEENLNFFSKPNEYPGLLEAPKTMAILGSESGSYQSLIELVTAGLECADRSMLMTPWGNYVVFRASQQGNSKKAQETKMFFLYDGCTCNINSFRYFDLSLGTAGFITFNTMNSLISYIVNSRYRREQLKVLCKPLLDDICVEKQPTGEENEGEASAEKVHTPRNSKK